MATGRVLSSADSLPLDWSLPNESPSDGLSLMEERQRSNSTHVFRSGDFTVSFICLLFYLDFYSDISIFTKKSIAYFFSLFYSVKKYKPLAFLNVCQYQSNQHC